MDSKLYKKALRLSYFTVAYNILEGIVSIFAGSLADSIALIGFGLDSFIESSSGFIMIWRFRKHWAISAISEEEEEKVEKKAVRYVAYTFLILAAYVLFESIKKLYLHETPAPSLFGIIIAIVSIIVMPLLFYLKYKTGKAINSPSLVADSKQTLTCLFLSAALLFGLVLNYFYGLWQADPIVGLIIVIFLIREGLSMLKEEKLFCC